MADPTPQLLLGTTPINSGAGIPLTAKGAELTLVMPPGRTLDRARLEIGAAPGSDASGPLTLDAVTTDSGALAGAAVRAVTASWANPAAITGLTITTSQSPATPKAARLRLLRSGIWQPLTPLDLVALDQAQRFPAIAASAMAAELLTRETVNNVQSPVFLPAAVTVTDVSVLATTQPCGVSAAIGDEAPFFTAPDPLPVSPVAVDGLARAVNRYLLDTPGATAVPLRLTAAGAATVIVGAWSTMLVPAPPDPGQPAPLPPGPVEAPYLVPLPLAAHMAQLCDPNHAAAQCFPPMPADRLLSSLGLYVRRTAQPVGGVLSLYTDAGGRPADTPLPGGSLPFTGGDPAVPGADWLGGRFTQPIDLSEGPWWVVCQVQTGACLWYAATPAPPAAGVGVARKAGNAWAPAAAAAGGWLQTRLLATPA